MQAFASVGMKVDSEGEHNSQGEGRQSLSGGSVESWTGSEAHVGHGDHLRNRGHNQCRGEFGSLRPGAKSAGISRVSATVND